jgi:hypothetical protein
MSAVYNLDGVRGIAGWKGHGTHFPQGIYFSIFLALLTDATQVVYQGWRDSPTNRFL